MMREPRHQLRGLCKEHTIHVGNQRTPLPVRFGKAVALILGGTVLSLLCLRFLVLPVLTQISPNVKSLALDSGLYGAYPERHYVSSNLTSPEPNVVRADSSCTDGLVLLSIGGQSVPGDGPIILDMAGNLVWSAPSEFGDASANTKIQRYNGSDYLTFWAGEKLQESGLGSYFMLNSAYEVVHEVSAVGAGLHGDLHEFKITADGSALVTVYERVSVDLSNTTSESAAGAMIVDGIFQEIDIASGHLIFEWRASEHLDHSALEVSDGGTVADGSLDYFHINSIDKDSRGNYLVSLRHLHILIYVNGRSGEIIWTLGNQAGDFNDLSGGGATSFRWQHDARWISEEEGIISLFNNGIAHDHNDATHSEGLIIQLDFNNWTATLQQSYTSLNSVGSPSQGDVQLMRETEDHVFIGWGASAVFSEHSLGGDLLCETHFGASWLFYFERVKSYRAFKTFNWKAIPTAWNPVAKIDGDEVFVSWNGATEVRYWSLERRLESNSSDDEPDFEEIKTVPKGSEFESSFKLPSTSAEVSYRVAALDVEKQVLRFSNIIVYKKDWAAKWIWIASLCGASIATTGAFYYLRRRALARNGEGLSHSFEYHALEPQ